LIGRGRGFVAVALIRFGIVRAGPALRLRLLRTRPNEYGPAQQNGKREHGNETSRQHTAIKASRVPTRSVLLIATAHDEK
jgi:hypothetical protein